MSKRIREHRDLYNDNIQIYIHSLILRKKYMLHERYQIKYVNWMYIYRTYTRLTDNETKSQAYILMTYMLLLSKNVISLLQYNIYKIL